jgi:hypothetical protein
MKQVSLFDQLQPRSLEVAGGDLIGVIKSLKERGAHVSGMTSMNTSGWRLTIEWPQEQSTLKYEQRMGF